MGLVGSIQAVSCFYFFIFVFLQALTLEFHSSGRDTNCPRNKNMSSSCFSKSPEMRTFVLTLKGAKEEVVSRSRPEGRRSPSHGLTTVLVPNRNHMTYYCNRDERMV